MPWQAKAMSALAYAGLAVEMSRQILVLVARVCRPGLYPPTFPGESVGEAQPPTNGSSNEPRINQSWADGDPATRYEGRDAGLSGAHNDASGGSDPPDAPRVNKGYRSPFNGPPRRGQGF